MAYERGGNLGKASLVEHSNIFSNLFLSIMSISFTDCTFRNLYDVEILTTPSHKTKLKSQEVPAKSKSGNFSNCVLKQG